MAASVGRRVIKDAVRSRQGYASLRAAKELNSLQTAAYSPAKL